MATPVIPAGKGFTTTEVDVKQPLLTVNVICTLPADEPVTTPKLGVTVAIAELPELQVPAPELLLSMVAKPTHTLLFPIIADGNGNTGMLLKA